jgi:hypothetical protein
MAEGSTITCQHFAADVNYWIHAVTPSTPLASTSRSCSIVPGRAGPPLAAAIDAAQTLVTRLHIEDTVSVVAHDDQLSVVAPPATRNAHKEDLALARVRGRALRVSRPFTPARARGSWGALKRSLVLLKEILLRGRCRGGCRYRRSVSRQEVLAQDPDLLSGREVPATSLGDLLFATRSSCE